MVSLVLHTGWPGLTHRAVKMAARVCISFSLSFSAPLFPPRAYIIYPRLGQRLDTIVIFIIVVVVVVVVVVVALSLHSRKSRRELARDKYETMKEGKRIRRENACAAAYVRHTSDKYSSRHAREATWDCAASTDAVPRHAVRRARRRNDPRRCDASVPGTPRLATARTTRVNNGSTMVGRRRE